MTTRNSEQVVLAEDPASTAWHLDKRIPVALLIGLMLNAMAGVWWASQINARVDTLERIVLQLSQDHDRIVRMETTLNGINDRLAANERQAERR